MEEIIKKLSENRRVERSKKILEFAGYSIREKSFDTDDSNSSNSKSTDSTHKFLKEGSSIQCPECGTESQYTNSDVEFDNKTKDYYVTCDYPGCHNRIKVDISKFAESIDSKGSTFNSRMGSDYRYTYYKKAGKYYKAMTGTHPLTPANGVEISKEEYEYAREYSKERGSVKESKEITLDSIKSASSSDTFMKDRAYITIDGREYQKIGKNKWEYNSNQSRVVGGTYSDEEIYDKSQGANSVELIDVKESKIIVKPYAGVNVEGFKVVKDGSTADYIYGRNASWSKHSATNQQPYVGDILRDLSREGELEFVDGENVFRGKKLSGDEFKKRFFSESLKNSEVLKEEAPYPGFDARTPREKVSKEGRRLIDKAKESSNIEDAWNAVDFLYDFPNAFYDYKGIGESKKLEESTYTRMEFPTEAEAREYAEENGMEIAKTQICDDKCVAWFRKFDYNPSQEREKLPESAQLATTPLSSEEKQEILAIFSKDNMDVLETREEQDHDDEGILMNLFVVVCDNSNPTYIGWCQSDLREYCEPQDIDYWTDVNDNGFYGKNYYFYKYLDDAE